MKLVRNDYTPDGIFGTLLQDDGVQIAATLEHAYLQDDGTYASKIPDGNFVCIRGMHQLEGMLVPFETFEITGVPNHAQLLFHIGNYNRDSSGCCLLGASRVGIVLVDSKIAFNAFMELMTGIDSFQLTVS